MSGLIETSGGHWLCLPGTLRSDGTATARRWSRVEVPPTEIQPRRTRNSAGTHPIPSSEIGPGDGLRTRRDQERKPAFELGRCAHGRAQTGTFRHPGKGQRRGQTSGETSGSKSNSAASRTSPASSAKASSSHVPSTSSGVGGIAALPSGSLLLMTSVTNSSAVCASA